LRRPAAAVLAAALVAFAPGASAGAATPTPTPGGPRIATVVDGAEFPTNMAFAPDGRLFYTEKETGRIRVVQDGRLLDEPFATLPVDGGGESGLLGLALDPNFADEPFVYAYFTSSEDGRNHIVRIRAEDGDPNRGGAPENMITLLTASGIHNGGDLAFGPDDKLYAVVGETGDEQLAQDPGSVGGKVLRLNTDGSIPEDNPFGPDNPAYTLGLRNSFGLCVNPHTHELWETENGPSSDDEVNRIEAGKNYGWPEQLGATGADGFQDPVLVFHTIIVPTGCAFFDDALSDRAVKPDPGGQLVFGDYHGDLHSVLLQPPDMHTVRRFTTEAHFDQGITDVEVGPDGNLYIATDGSILALTGATGIPFTPAGPQSPPATTAPSADDGGLGTGTIVLIVAAIVLAVDGVFVLIARARKRRREAARDGSGDEDGSAPG
jgi:glucose/arabinose dehydrogenase